MTTSHEPTGQAIFTDAELEQLWAEDRSAATAVVFLLVTIFSVGLFGYIAVSLWVASDPHLLT